MLKLKAFINSSKTFNSFTFAGHYDMPENVFFKLFSHYTTTGINLLDAYSRVMYLTWDINDDGFYYLDELIRLTQDCDDLERVRVLSKDTLHKVRQYLIAYRHRYERYLERLTNEPRRTACKFTALPEVKEYIFSLYGKHCLCCGSEEKISMDHVVPISKGGKNEISNLQPLCKSCNSRKGIKIIDYRHE